MTEQHQLRISLLGGFKIAEGDNTLSAIGTPRLQALVAYLLLHRDAPQPRQQIAFLFWPDSSEEQAQANLRNLLMTLGRIFPGIEQYAALERRTLQWRDSDNFSLDVSGFERNIADAEIALRAFNRSPEGEATAALLTKLQSAVALYSGDLLPSCYDEWILAPREQLRQSFLWALGELVSLLEGLAESEPGMALLYAQRLLRHDPLQEENYRRLMRLHLGMGDRTGAALVYRQCERMMKRELGLEPSKTTRELLRRTEELSKAESGRDRGTKLKTSKGRIPAPGNIPAQTTSFIGREQDVATIARQLRLPECRLITLVGSPGTGKTRLALQVASVVRQFQDGAYFVQLAPLEASDQIERAIAQALGITESGAGSLRQYLINSLAGSNMLLVLDNFEHLLPDASVISDLLAGCPDLKVLATSRAPLNLRGEREYIVPAMGVPGADSSRDPGDLAQYEAVALFVERALEVSPQFALKRENARTIAEICRRLEGLPLAIELAAARVKALSPEAILSRLDRRLKLLVGGKIDMPPRQRALESAIGWSYNLLGDEEKRLFRGLSVFAGGCSLDAAEGVLGSETSDSVLDTITSLLNKSLLVRIDLTDGEQSRAVEPRFGMLETLKEYGSERLSESGEFTAVSRQHMLYFAELVEKAEANLFGPNQIMLFEQIEREYDNITSSLRWAHDNHDVDTALRMTGALDRFWERRGHLPEARAWLERILLLPDPGYDISGGEYRRWARSRANGLRALGRLQFRLGDYALAEETLLESVGLFEAVGDKTGLADALNLLATSVGVNEYDRALEIHERCLLIRREIDDRWGIVASLQTIALIKIGKGDFFEARALCEEALAIHQGEGQSDLKAAVLYALGLALLGLHDVAEGEGILEECVQICRELKNNRLMGWALHDLANSAYSQGNYERSRLLNAESLERFNDQGARPGIGHAYARLGRDAHRRGEYEEAGQLYLRALSVGWEMKLQPVLGQSFAGLAGIASVLGQFRTSALLFGKAQSILSTIYSSIEREEMTLNMAEARDALGATDWEELRAEGHIMAIEEAYDLVRNLRY